MQHHHHHHQQNAQHQQHQQQSGGSSGQSSSSSGGSGGSTSNASSLTSMLSENVNTYECSLYGILTTPVNLFVQRVKGMMRSDHKFSYKETVYRSTVVSSGPMWAENSILPSEIHVRTEKTKASPRNPISSNSKDRMSARYVGTPQIKDKINAVIRNVVDISVSDRFIQLIENMGYVKDYEYYVDGYCFSTYYISLFLVQLSRSLPDGSQGESLSKNSMIELQCLSGEEGFSQAADYLNTYAEYLYPYVELIKFDHRNLIYSQPTTQQQHQPGTLQHHI